MREALDHTQKTTGKDSRGRPRHVSPQELLQGIREHALTQFGPMVMTVLSEWGIRNCRDFGEIVFNMVENELLAKTEEDTRAGFAGGYDFDEAFRKPFLPSSKQQQQPTSGLRSRTTIAPRRKSDKKAWLIVLAFSIHTGDRCEPLNPLAFAHEIHL